MIPLNIITERLNEIETMMVDILGPQRGEEFNICVRALAKLLELIKDLSTKEMDMITAKMNHLQLIYALENALLENKK